MNDSNMQKAIQLLKRNRVPPHAYTPTAVTVLENRIKGIAKHTETRTDTHECVKEKGGGMER